jgi:hypothetical protein
LRFPNFGGVTIAESEVMGRKSWKVLHNMLHDLTGFTQNQFISLQFCRAHARLRDLNG